VEITRNNQHGSLLTPRTGRIRNRTADLLTPSPAPYYHTVNRIGTRILPQVLALTFYLATDEVKSKFNTPHINLDHQVMRNLIK
jgi:hypothetical protein